MMATMIIRPATVADAVEMGRLHVRGWQRGYAGLLPAVYLDSLDPVNRAESWARILQLPPVPGRTTLLAVVDGQIVGFAGIGPTRDDDQDPARIGEVYAIYTDPHRWGQGIGGRLMAESTARLAAAGFAAATLWVLDDNERAIRFYGHGGWSDDGTTKSAEIGGVAVCERRLVCDLVLRPAVGSRSVQGSADAPYADRVVAASIDWFTRPGQDGPGLFNLTYNLLDRHVIRGRADEIALVVQPAAGEQGKVVELTFAELLGRVAQLAGGFQVLGVGTGDRVVVDYPPGLERVMALLAVARIGALLVESTDPAPALRLSAELLRIHRGPTATEPAQEYELATLMRPGQFEPAACRELPGDTVLAEAPVRTQVAEATDPASVWAPLLAGNALTVVAAESAAAPAPQTASVEG